MAVRVIVLKEQSVECLFEWAIEAGPVLDINPWNELALKLIERARHGRSGRAEIYLCFDAEDLIQPDLRVIRDLCSLARSFSWGSEVYAVMSNWSPIPQGFVDSPDLVSYWFQAILSCDIDDLLQAMVDLRSEGGPEDAILLRSAFIRAQIRDSIRRRLRGNGSWRAVVENDEGELARFLHPLVWYPQSASSEHGLAFLVGVGRSSQRRRVERQVKLYQPERSVVATLKVRSDSDLRQYCQEVGIPLVEFRSRLELRYFLHSIQPKEASSGALRKGDPLQGGLNELPAIYRAGVGRLAEDFKALGITHPAYIEALGYEIRVRENLSKEEMHGSTEVIRHERSEIMYALNELALRVAGIPFNQYCELNPEYELSSRELGDRNSFPAVVVTNALNPESERELCLAAARVVARIRQDLGPEPRFEVLLAASLDSLSAIMGNMTGPIFWVHLGSADGSSGLREASGRCVGIRDWLSCFPDFGRDLVAAVLLARDSQAIAESLVRHGVRCAVGFAGNREQPDLFLRPARELVRLLLHDDIDCSALRERLADLGSEYGGSRYVAFCAESG